jgi:putative membrane protein
MRGLLIRFLVTGVAVLVASEVVPGISLDSLSAGIAAAVVLAVLNAVIRPVLYLLTLPFIIVTLGLFMVIVNAVLLQLAAWLVKGFHVEGFWASVLGAILISVVSTILNLWVSERGTVEIITARPRSPRIVN